MLWLPFIPQFLYALAPRQPRTDIFLSNLVLRQPRSPAFWLPFTSIFLRFGSLPQEIITPESSFDIEIYDLAPFHRAITGAIDALAPFHPLVCHRFGSPHEAISLPFGSPPSPDAWLVARNSHVHSPFLPFFLPGPFFLA